MFRKFIDRVLGRDESREPMTYEESKRLAASHDPAVRKELAARDDLKPEVLYFLAEDEAAEVRAIAAANAKAPHQADRMLAEDKSDDVRAALAVKIARVAPNLPPETQEKVRDRVYEVLRILVEDQLPRVRRILAEEMKHAANVPKDVVDRLARDKELEVASPILQYSPLLSDQDLLDIINSAPVQGAISAIAKRKNVSEKVSDAVVSAEDVPAVAALLANDSAQIREETLDRIVEKAPAIEGWHEPLVVRRQMPPRLLKRIAGFVTSSLLDVMSKREDLDAQTAVDVAFLVKERLATQSETASSTAAARAAEAFAQGRLGEADLLEALDRPDSSFVIHGLALKSGLDLPVVHKMLDSGSGKAVVALVWKAGYAMSLATVLQHRLARVPPGAILQPKKETEFPLSENDMEWYVSFYDDK